PVFAQFTGGPGVLFKPTFGFILSYILVAYIAGKIVESKSRPTVITFMIASFTAFILNYVLGTNYMYYAYKFWADAPEGFTYGMAWLWMLAPLPKDILLSVVAALISPRIYAAVSKTSKRPQ
ncbi:biotin transporter BioY, partial [Staphylococcus sp. SIMBA_130]